MALEESRGLGCRASGLGCLRFGMLVVQGV